MKDNELSCYSFGACIALRLKADRKADGKASRRSRLALMNASNLEFFAAIMLVFFAYPERCLIKYFFSEETIKEVRRLETFHSDSVVNILRPADDPFSVDTPGYKEEEDGWKQRYYDSMPTIETAITYFEERLDEDYPQWRILKSDA